MSASNETPIADGAGGFRRVTPAPPPGAVARLRQQLVALTRGRPAHVQRGLQALQQWDNLALLCGGAWFADLLRGSRRGRWTLERRLTLLGQPPTTADEAHRAPLGTAVKLLGTAHRLGVLGTRCATAHIGNLWENSTQRALDVCEVEEGRDFLLATPGGSIRVVGQGGHLLHGARLEDGGAVCVLGFVDRVVDPAAADGSRAPALVPVLRSGDELPLLLWCVSPSAPPNHS